MHRHDTGVLKLAADLCLFDEPADHLRLVAIPIAQHLDSEVAAQVGVIPLEYHSHPAVSNQVAKL